MVLELKWTRRLLQTNSQKQALYTQQIMLVCTKHCWFAAQSVYWLYCQTSLKVDYYSTFPSKTLASPLHFEIAKWAAGTGRSVELPIPMGRPQHAPLNKIQQDHQLEFLERVLQHGSLYMRKQYVAVP
ncbi:MAG: hypothetical protein EZS28_047051 [Streblomastix strix]|uniref:Uncharacterized protein n=1 Tax=Streblomastix strix TaxID=222440 RepID=A0A5J4THR9_9EUKA|nr:MAG: hypothetical protein EZS28_047051 [Streblomastix strix]